MKAISAALKAHLAQEVTSLCTCWEIYRKDGVSLYFTDLDVPLLFGGVEYLPAAGYNKTAIESSSDMSVDNFDVIGLLDHESITPEDIRALRYDYAESRIFLVNWQDPSMGVLRVKRGTLGEAQILPNGTFRTEFRGLGEKLLQTLSTPTSPECRNDLGDNWCTININGDGWPRTGAVVEVLGRSTFAFTVTDVDGEDPRALADETWYRGGVLTWTSGNNKDRNIEIKACSSADHTIQLFLRMEVDIQLGDEFIMRPGCDKREATCFGKFHNVINMKAEPYKPGKDLLSQFPNMPYQS
jgi:uncharacterized phage protein (TIGR02218 family)